MENLLTKCAECGEDFYVSHKDNCSKEENIEMCGICDRFYHKQGKPIYDQCLCDSEVR
jgi:hypothetical protein